jgi:RNA:NAD 2'-phosphotransferase (TPT1/KptA family)
MLSLNIGDTVLLTKGEATIFDKVAGFSVGKDYQGSNVVLYVKTEQGLGVKLGAEYRMYENEVWTVDEVNCCAPEYTLAEQAI